MKMSVVVILKKTDQGVLKKAKVKGDNKVSFFRYEANQSMFLMTVELCIAKSNCLKLVTLI